VFFYKLIYQTFKTPFSHNSSVSYVNNNKQLTPSSGLVMIDRKFSIPMPITFATLSVLVPYNLAVSCGSRNSWNKGHKSFTVLWFLYIYTGYSYIYRVSHKKYPNMQTAVTPKRVDFLYPILLVGITQNSLHIRCVRIYLFLHVPKWQKCKLSRTNFISEHWWFCLSAWVPTCL